MIRPPSPQTLYKLAALLMLLNAAGIVVTLILGLQK